MKPRQPGQRPSDTFAAEVAEEIVTLQLAGLTPRASGKGTDGRDLQAWCARNGIAGSDSDDREQEPATLLPAITPDVTAYRLLGEARAIIAELTSPYWDHKAQGRARDWVRRFDEEQAAARVRAREPIVAITAPTADSESKGHDCAATTPDSEGHCTCGRVVSEWNHDGSGCQCRRGGTR